VRFSLIMASVDRTSEPERFLASLNAQSYRAFELIVVDQNPDDRLVPLVRSYEDKFPITYMRERMRGASRARNIGMEYASGEILAFPDDDCWYPPDLLGKVVQKFVHHPELDGLTGRLTDGYGHTVMGRFDLRPGRIEESNVWARGIEATTFLRRSRLEDRRFDESLGLGAGTMWGGGEVTDLLLGLLADGKLLYYYPDTIINHPPLTRLYDAKASRKAYLYACGMGRVLRMRKTPLRYKVKWLIRPLGGTVLFIMALKPARARYHFNIFRGRLRGMLL
jgi:glycosyltransferase involved in cell wall biosynthesis